MYSLLRYSNFRRVSLQTESGFYLTSVQHLSITGIGKLKAECSNHNNKFILVTQLFSFHQS